LSHVVKQDGCWGWTGKVQEDGYAYYSLGSEYPAYRVSYVMHHGPVPLGLVVRHTCHNRLCVNPDHLILGTQTENVADMVESGRSKLCGPRGLRLGPPPPRQKSNWSPERVLALRQALGFSQEQLARELHVTAITIHRWESGKTDPSRLAWQFLAALEAKVG
jgi:DNA-binding XRE family transcriptional regulator